MRKGHVAIRRVQGGERDGERIPDQGPAHRRVASSPALLGNCSEIAESNSPDTSPTCFHTPDILEVFNIHFLSVPKPPPLSLLVSGV